MRELRLKSQKFREEHEADWRRLDTLVTRAEKGSLRSLDEKEVVELAVLYRSALSSLSVARATSLDQGAVEYLESLAARAYFYVYGTRTSFWGRVGRFFRRDWPLAAQALWRETLVSGLLFVLGIVVAWVLIGQDPDWFYAFVSPDMIQGRDPTASAASLREGLYDKPGKDGLTVFSTFLFTHNARVALFAFALGFAFCLPTAFLLTMTGCMLGAFLRLYANHGLGAELVGWLMIHGTTELLAIILAGGAGFRIGWTLIFPGARSRVEAAGEAGRTAAVLMCGTVVMLFIAGLLEGFGRQLITADLARYAIAAVTGVVWLTYLYFPRSPEVSSHG